MLPNADPPIPNTTRFPPTRATQRPVVNLVELRPFVGQFAETVLARRPLSGYFLQYTLDSRLQFPHLALGQFMFAQVFVKNVSDCPVVMILY